MLFLLMVLMFIGASSSSTGGGIKTSTFAIVLADVWRTVRGADHTQIFKRTINSVLQSRAYSVLLFYCRQCDRNFLFSPSLNLI